MMRQVFCERSWSPFIPSRAENDAECAIARKLEKGMKFLIPERWSYGARHSEKKKEMKWSKSTLEK